MAIKHLLRPPKNLAGNWLELILVVSLLILLAPIIIVALIIAAPILGFEAAWGRLRKEPHPEIPSIGIDTNRNSEFVAKDLSEKAAQLLGKVTVEHDAAEQSYTLTSSESGNTHVHFSYRHGLTGIYIDKLNCYEWDTASADNIDLFFWIAIAVLRYGALPGRSKFGRLGYWVRCDELRVWARVQKEGSNYDSILFYNEPPGNIKSKFEAHR